MQMCLSTSTMPSARLNEAPVGHTSTQGGSAQCWHITGSDCVLPVRTSLISILRIHCAPVGPGFSGRPFSDLQAVTQSVQPLLHFVLSISMPQRTWGRTGAFARRCLRDFDQSDAGRQQHASQTNGCCAQEAAAFGMDSIPGGVEGTGFMAGTSQWGSRLRARAPAVQAGRWCPRDGPSGGRPMSPRAGWRGTRSSRSSPRRSCGS